MEIILINKDILERNGFNKRHDAPVYVWRKNENEISVDLGYVEDDYVSTIHDYIAGRFRYLDELQDAINKLGIDKQMKY